VEVGLVRPDGVDPFSERVRYQEFAPVETGGGCQTRRPGEPRVDLGGGDALPVTNRWTLTTVSDSSHD
jgi:hypothetical protein